MGSRDQYWRTVGHLGDAYEALLRLPDGGSRLRLQSTMATLRDEIALIKGETAEAVQSRYETEVMEYPNR